MKMGKWRRGLALFLVFILIAGFLPAPVPANAKSKKVKMGTKKLVLTVGKSKKIKLLNNSKKVKWSTSKKKVVKITKKSRKYVKVKALKVGKAKITAKLGKKKYVCRVTVKAKEDVSKPEVKRTPAAVTKRPTQSTPPTQEPAVEPTSQVPGTLATPTPGTEVKPTPENPSGGEIDFTGKPTRLEWMERLLDSVGVETITEDAVTKDLSGNPLYTYSDVEEQEDNLLLETAVNEGILVPNKEGYSAPVFHLEESVTREFAAVTAARALGYLESKNALDCTDKESLEYPCWDEVAVNVGLLELQDGAFNGTEELTGAEAKKILDKVKEISAQDTEKPEKVVDIQYKDNVIKDAVADMTDYVVSETETGYQVVMDNAPESIGAAGLETGKSLLLPADSHGKYRDGFACKITAIRNMENKTVIIGKPIKSVFEVIESFQLSGSYMANQIILADGITMNNADDGQVQGRSGSKQLGDAGTVTVPGELSLSKKINDNFSIDFNMKAPELIYDIQCSKAKIDRFKFVVSNSGSISATVKGEVGSAPPDINFDVFKTPVPLGGGFFVDFLFKLQGSISGNLSWTVDIAKDIGIDSQKETKIVDDGYVEMGGNYGITISAGPRMDIVLDWLDDEFIVIADLNLGVGAQFASNTVSAQNIDGREIRCRDNALSVYCSIGVGDLEDSLLHKIGFTPSYRLEKPLLAIHLEAQGDFTDFRGVPECTAVKNVYGDVIDKYGRKVKSSQVIVRSKAAPEKEIYVDNRTAGQYKCRIPNGTYEVMAVWDGVIKVRQDVTISGDTKYDIYEGKVADSSTGPGYSWSLTENGNFECEVEEQANTSYIKDIIQKHKTDITSAYVHGVVGAGITSRSLADFFNGCENLASVNVSELDVRNVTSTAQMFRGCVKLERLEFGEFKTGNVTNMSGMFYGCHALKKIDVSSFDTSNITLMNSLFGGCVNLEDIDMRTFNTRNVTDMHGMFYACRSLKRLNLVDFRTDKVKDMSAMFQECEKLEKLDVSNFNTGNVMIIQDMFDGCTALKELNLSSFSLTNAMHTTRMFRDCKSLKKLDVGSFGSNKATNTSHMFSGCESLTDLSLAGFDTSRATDMSYMFADCENLTNIDLQGFHAGNATKLQGMFNGCKRLKELDLSSFDTGSAEDMSEMFASCEQLTELDLSGLDTGCVTELSGMFKDCTSLEKLDLSNFDTGNVVDMSYMFQHCESLAELDLSNFDTSNVIYMHYMFDNCVSLTELDLSSFDTVNVINVSYMFCECEKLTDLDISTFDVSNVVNMRHAFAGCDKSIIPVWYMDDSELEDL